MAEPMDPQLKQKLLFAVLLLGGLGYFGFEYVYRPRSAEVAELEQRLEVLQTRNQTARALSEQQGRSEVERRLRVYRRQLATVEGLIPSSEELPDLLDAISAEAQRAGVELALIQPVGASEEQFYTRRTYELAVRGTYHQIGAFLTEIASLPRIITPTSLSLLLQGEDAVEAEPQLEAKFAIETYVLPSEQPTDTSHAQ